MYMQLNDCEEFLLEYGNIAEKILNEKLANSGESDTSDIRSLIFNLTVDNTIS